MPTCSSGLKLSHSLIFGLTLKIKGGELSILVASTVPRAALPRAGAFNFLSL